MTALEAIVWVGMFIVAMTAVTSAVIYFYRTSNYTIQEASAVTSAQQGIDKMVRAIREAAFSSNGAYPVVSLATSSLTFYADVDSDTSIERVHYYLDGTNLVQGILDPAGDPPSYVGSESTSTISDNVRNIVQALNLFTFYNASGTVMTDLTQIGSARFVTINVAVDVDTTRSPVPVFIRSSAALRNLIGR